MPCYAFSVVGVGCGTHRGEDLVARPTRLLDAELGLGDVAKLSPTAMASNRSVTTARRQLPGGPGRA
jgi:hypothetical protein